jgi:alkanesulfonate monooxygenase SsuD/methylene tetrahydromethanopterin reductase-like flavin-dependent oxidoreductase (luciferase family)
VPGVAPDPIRVCLMIEGQEDVGWDEWQAVAAACERGGFDALFRSDHYVSVEDRRERGSLDAWGTICGLAAATSRIRLGTLVSPVTFRHPSVLAKLAVTADHISGGGRIELGMGAGWWEVEHRLYGFPFPPTGDRVRILAEQLEIVRREWRDKRFSFEGTHYRIEALDALPKPLDTPRLILGGRAGPRSAELAARWADEYNTVFATPEECASRRRAIGEAAEKIGRDPAALAFSLMTGCIVGSDAGEVRERARRLAEWREGPGANPDEFLAVVPESWVVGDVGQVTDQLRELHAAGVDRVMLQDLLFKDIEMIDLIGREVIPALR